MSEFDVNKLSDAELLVAYLDGALDQPVRDEIVLRMELEPELRALHDVLMAGERPFKESFDLVLEDAPMAKLSEMLDGLGSGAAVDPGMSGAARPERGVMRYAMAAALALALFGAGVFTGRISTPLPDGSALVDVAKKGGDAGAKHSPVPNPGKVQVPGKAQMAGKAKGWRQAVAEYFTLYDRSSIELLPDHREMQIATLKRLSEATGTDYLYENLVSDKMQYKRGQLLKFMGKPLLQFVYLYGGTKPVALCIVANGKKDKAAAFETRNGFNIVHWVAGGRAFMLLGKVDEAALFQLAKTFRKKLG